MLVGVVRCLSWGGVGEGRVCIDVRCGMGLGMVGWGIGKCWDERIVTGGGRIWVLVGWLMGW